MVFSSAALAGGASSVEVGPNAGGVAPYVLPVANDVSITSILTTGYGAANDGYALAGTPDGLGAFVQGRSVVVYANHEFGSTAGAVRDHGQTGSFVSRWELNRKNLSVSAGRDLIQHVNYWDYSAAIYADAPVAPAGAAAGTHTAAFNRFCSGYLAEAGSLYNKRTKNGYKGSLWMGNEESGDEGRLFAVADNGEAYQIPRAGLFSGENHVVAPTSNDTTLMVGNEDGAGQLWIYAGTKQRSGSPVDQAGLTNGNLFVVDVADEAVSTDADFRATYGKGVAAPVTFGANEAIDWTQNGATQNAEAAAKGLTLVRIEDGAFDPEHRNDYYFLTTEGGDTTDNPAEPGIARNGGGLWRLSFADVNRPELGGTLTLLLDGSEAPYLSKPDNMAIDTEGNLLIQEDPGGSDHIARIVAYRIEDGALGVVAQFDPALFGVTNPAGTSTSTRAVLTTDEESSGIIDTKDIFGDGSFLFDAQVHTNKNLSDPATLVENGQLLLLQVDEWDAVYGDDGHDGHHGDHRGGGKRH